MLTVYFSTETFDKECKLIRKKERTNEKDILNAYVRVRN